MYILYTYMFVYVYMHIIFLLMLNNHQLSIDLPLNYCTEDLLRCSERQLEACQIIRYQVRCAAEVCMKSMRNP